MTTVSITRSSDETWRECVIRYARPWGLVAECLERFDHDVRAGEDEAQAALDALWEWDICDLKDPRL